MGIVHYMLIILAELQMFPYKPTAMTVEFLCAW